jgi:hypothetical protein
LKVESKRQKAKGKRQKVKGCHLSPFHLSTFNFQLWRATDS